MARRSFRAWCELSLRPFDQVPQLHHDLIIREVESVSRGEVQRLMICMPPGSAKSTYASQLAPSWLMAQKPHLQIIGASHTTTFAEDISRKVQGYIRGRENVLGYGLATESATLWSTTNGGRYLAAGVGSSIAGFRADLAIVDDPMKGRKSADSEADRNTAWNWFAADLRTRLKPHASIIVIMCMVGRTRVMMADGTEKYLKDIRCGDAISTYDNGFLRTSVVKNWKSQGMDRVFEIRTKSGAAARANARHPFLIERGGARTWVRLQDIQVGDLAVRVNETDRLTSRAEDGREFSAGGTDAISRPRAKDTATLTTISRAGLTGTAPHQTTPPTVELPGYCIGTASPKMTTKPFSWLRMACALFARSRRPKTFGRIGGQSSASTMTMPMGRFEGSYATTATSWLATVKPNPLSAEARITSSFILDQITEITDVGRDEVFDVQIERTSNFIADGFVSHNTRWHEDDIGGRLIESHGDSWRVLKLPAIAVEDDPLGRDPGQWLWDDDPDYDYGRELREVLKEYQEAGAMRDWYSLYQQDPRPLDGSIFKVGKISIIPAAPAGGKMVRGWDLAATEKTGTRDPDWTTGLKLARYDDGSFVVQDVRRFRGGPDDVERTIVNTAKLDGRGVTISLPQDPGQAGKSQILYLTRKLAGFVVHTSPESGDKATRASPAASQTNVGNLSLVEGSWNRPFIEELRSFPSGAKDDQVDALSRAFFELIAPPAPARRACVRIGIR